MVGSGFHDRDRSAEYVCLGALNSWNQFCRAYLFSCAHRLVLESGAVIIAGPSIRTHHDVIREVLRVTRRKPNLVGPWARREEPAWHRPNTVTLGAASLSLSNRSVISAAFSIGTATLDDLLAARNFYAHRNDETVGIVRDIAFRYSIAATHPTDVIEASAYGRPGPLASDWIADLRGVSRLLCA